MKSRLCQIMNWAHNNLGEVTPGEPACPAMFCAWALTLLLACSAAEAVEDTAGGWQRWEHELVSDRDYANPCDTVESACVSTDRTAKPAPAWDSGTATGGSSFDAPFQRQENGDGARRVPTRPTAGFMTSPVSCMLSKRSEPIP